MLRNLIASKANGVLLFNENGKIEIFNEACERLFQYSRTEAIGQSVAILMPARYRLRIERLVEGITHPSSSFAVGWQRRGCALRKDGTIFPISLSIGVAKYQGKKLFVAIIEDLNPVERKYHVRKAERSLLAMAAACSTDGIVVATLDGTIRAWNHAAELIYGYRAVDMIGKQITEVLALLSGSDRIAGKLDLFAKAFAGEVLPPYESECIHASGYAIRVRASLSPIRNVQGVMVGLSITFRDITERRALDTRRALSDAVIESSSDAIITSDLSGTITSWNPAAEKMLGYALQQMIGSPIAAIFPQSTRFDLQDELSRVYADEAARRREIKVLRKDGAPLDVLAAISAVMDERGVPRGMSFIFHDVAIERMLDRRSRALREALLQLGRLNEMNQVSAGMAHELNQPLAAINNYARTAARLLDKPLEKNIAKLREIMLKLSEQAIRSGEVIKRSRQRIEKSGANSTLEDINEVVEEVVAVGPIDLKLSNAKISLSLSPDLPHTHIDRLQMQQVILNLLRNAIDAVASSPLREITVATKKTDQEEVEVSIADTGTGIPASIQNQLFMPFVTTKPHGLGLGLAMARSIIEAHNGHIFAEPNNYCGTIIRFTIPIAM